jgi:hypothetical protein
MRPGWPELLDPLVVTPPIAALSDLDEWDEEEVSAAGQVEVGLAPDDLHKDNISGGSPYSVLLPDPSADFVLLYERHELRFVPYLRLAILQWGGFPGLDQQQMPFAPLAELLKDLEPF